MTLQSKEFKRKKKRCFVLQHSLANIWEHNRPTCEPCCFINAGSILMVLRGFMFSGLGDITGESASSLHPSCLGGFALSLWTCFQHSSTVTHFLACAWTRLWFGLDREPAPAPRGRQTRRKRARGGERVEQGVRGMEQIRNRCLYTCDSAFRNWAGTEPNYFSLYLPFMQLFHIPQVGLNISLYGRTRYSYL